VPQDSRHLLHLLVDIVVPVATGLLLGVAVHYLRLRGKMARLERERADALRGELHKLTRDRAVFLVGASLLHELKHPLHNLGLLLEELQAHAAGEDPVQDELLLRARAQSERISARLGALREVPSPEPPHRPLTDLEELGEDVSESFRSLHKEGLLRFEFRSEAARPLRTHPEYVRLILQTLFENAVDALREAGRGGCITLRLQGTPEGARFSLEDDGPGLSPEARAHLFEPLHTTKEHGWGLGLSVARALARTLGGELSLQADAPRTTFVLSLPEVRP